MEGSQDLKVFLGADHGSFSLIQYYAYVHGCEIKRKEIIKFSLLGISDIDCRVVTRQLFKLTPLQYPLSGQTLFTDSE